MSDAESASRYFLSNRRKIKVDFREEESTASVGMLREAQAGAYWAVRSHFTVSDVPALVVMPTGSGKTAVMTLTAFGLVEKRLLIIAPNRVITEQIEREFQTLDIARETGCLPEDVDAPKVHVVKHKLRSKDAWDDLAKFDVVVSTAHCVSPSYQDVYDEPPSGLFDVIFFDEAHHWPARTWDNLGRAFPGARVVGFTATPYRSDKKPIPGEIVYSYPMRRAIDKGIYRQIEFVAVQGHGDKRVGNRRLAKRAKELWDQENKTRQTKLLVRVGRIKDTKPIRDLYAEVGLHLEIVSSERSLKENERAIKRAREEESCHGLIAVGMLGEGLDLPDLGIAVLHNPYHSFPITLQFIGRICRVSDRQQGPAKLLAIPQEVEEHTRGLYDLDANWAELIPHLADAAVGLEKDRRRFVSDRWPLVTAAREVSVHTIRPAFSVTVYRIGGTSVDVSSDPQLSGDTQVFQSFVSRDGSWRILITRTITKPLWTTSDVLQEVGYDLFIYYRVGDLLFQSATSPGIAAQIRKSFGQSQLRLVDPDRVQQVIGQSDVLAYYSVGMRKVSYAGASVPTYKMMAGGHAEAAVRASDALYFSVGHLFGRVKWIDEEIVLGMSGNSGKIWASARDHLMGFTSWCDEIARKLVNDTVAPLPHVSALKKPERATSLPARPYAVSFSESFYGHVESGLILELGDHKGATRVFCGSQRFELSVIRDSWKRATPQKCSLRLEVGDVAVTVHYDLKAESLFRCELAAPYESCTIRIAEKGRFRPSSLEEYLAKFPPTLYLMDGSAIVGDVLYAYQPPSYNVPEELFRSVDWDGLGCEITIEDVEMIQDATRKQQISADGKCSVLDATAKILRESLSDKAVIFNDHHSGEIADYVALEQEDNALRIHLVHCKASGMKNPGARQEDAYSVLAQAQKCTRWLYRSDLLEVMRGRMSPDKLVRGTLKDFDQLIALGSARVARYTVYIVQPGFDAQKIQQWHDPSIRLMMLSLYDYLRNNGVDLRIVCS